ncbi:MAG: fused MFS/spermidine synthase [Thermodesulfobacteriota bacterium]
MDSARLKTASLLLFLSGTCALAYQVGWLRELRLVFGASTASSAAVLAIFMGGLGAGGAILGRRADTSPAPLRFYGILEVLVGLLAAVSPLLMSLIRTIYIALGGSQALGAVPGTLVRLGLAALVLGVPTFLMGGTMPAASRAVEDMADVGRRKMAFLYGINTLGAVLGAFVSTFFFLEIFGTRRTLWLASMVNILVGVAALSLSRKPMFAGGTGAAPKHGPPPESLPSPAPPRLIYISAFLVGGTFFLMEIVWYRMLGPILGGSTYTFGMILCVALLGIGIGGALFALVSSRSTQASLRAFCITLILEAFFVALPYAMGDRIAVFAALLLPLSVFGLKGQMISWLLITGVTVLPAAIVSGYQFPLLVSLLGRGGEKIGRQLGNTYAWNTVGAIVGSLAGGFGLLPALSATGCWVLASALLVFWGLVCLAFSFRQSPGILRLALPTALAMACCLLLIFAQGPTAVWRHSPIGAGRVDITNVSMNEVKRWMRDTRRVTVWQKDGVESSIAISDLDSYAFVVNGKIDGSSVGDAPTQVAVGLTSALFHPHPKTAMVIGLGTGETAGWLAKVPSMEKVDVAELEPDIKEVARRCKDMNHDVLTLPNVNILYGDGREILLTSKEKYDLIVSEPSNPFRAGVASLYTREFYEAVAGRLDDNGVFNQWLQAYEVDPTTLRTIMATLTSVFPQVELWQSLYSDMQVLCYKKPTKLDAGILRERLATEPFRSGFGQAWWTNDLEGFLARFLAADPLVRKVSAKEREFDFLNTDDRMLVEFGFARTVGKKIPSHVAGLRLAAAEMKADRPDIAGSVDWRAVADHVITNNLLFDQIIPAGAEYDEQQVLLAEAVSAIVASRPEEALEKWKLSGRKATQPAEWIMLGESYAEGKDPTALAQADLLQEGWPMEAEAVRALYFNATGQAESAVEALSRVIRGLRKNPWPENKLMKRMFARLINNTLKNNKDFAARIFNELAVPFSTGGLEELRKSARVDLSAELPPQMAASAYLEFEPNPIYLENFLRNRLLVYSETRNPLAAKAQKDLTEFLSGEMPPFASVLLGSSFDDGRKSAAESAGR